MLCIFIICLSACLKYSSRSSRMSFPMYLFYVFVALYVTMLPQLVLYLLHTCLLSILPIFVFLLQTLHGRAVG